VQRAIERVTGERGDGCPWRASRDLFVQRVVSSHRHWTKGELGSRWGGNRRVPEALLRGCEIFDAALQSVQSFDIKQQSQPREQLPPEQPHSGVRITRSSVHSVRQRRGSKT